MTCEPSTEPVLCIGALVHDTLAISCRPLKVGDDLPGRAATRPGGVAANIALSLAANGTPSALLSAVGEDAVAQQLINALQARGVDCSRVFRLPGASDQVVTLENPDGERFAAVAACQQIGVLAASHGESIIHQVRNWRGQVVVDSNLPTSAQDAVLLAASGGVTLVPASLDKAAQLASLISTHGPRVIVNLQEANAVLDAKHTAAAPAADALYQLGAREAIVTDGAREASLVNANGLFREEPEPVRVRSTTGAGDNFAAGVLSAENLSDHARLRAALAAATRHLAKQ